MPTMGVGAWEWDMYTGRLLADDRALAMVGLERATFDERFESWAVLVHPDDADRVFAEVEQAITARTTYNIDYRVCRPDGAVVWIEARGYVAFDGGGEPQRMAGTIWESAAKRMSRDAIGRALRHMPDGFLAVDEDWRIIYCNDEAERIFGAAATLLGRELWDAVPDTRALGLEAVHRRTAGTLDGFDVRGPSNQHWYRLRLTHVPGGLAVYFTDITEQRAQEAERARATARAERTAHVAELTEALAQALTMSDVVQTMADYVMPLFGATGLLVSTLEDDRVVTAGSRGYSREFLDLIDRVRVETLPAVADVLRTRTPKFISSVDEYLTLYPGHKQLRSAGGKQSWVFLPLLASGRSIGCCVIAFDKPGSLSEEERTLLIALSSMAAQALERARLYDAEHARAKQLQRGLLPRTLPALPAALSAARYLPAGTDMDVGGDWYDVIALSSERVALVIGDVMGHGLSEAVTMGRLRTAVRTLADLEIPPDEVLARLNAIVNDFGEDSFATCLYAVYDPTARTLALASAGHPPPAIVLPDGNVRFPAPGADPPLGVAGPPFATAELVLPDDSLIVLYTDGLVESADRDIEHGMQRLAETLGTAFGQLPRLAADGSASHAVDSERLEYLCDTVVLALLPTGEQTSDDAAVLITHTRGMAENDVASWPLPDDAVAAGQARRLTGEQLHKWNLDALAATTELLVSELVANVVRHATGPIQLRLLRGRTLVCEVSDTSPTTPRIRHAAETDEGGRGLQLVAALAHRWGTRHTATGKCIWTEQLLP
jgi:PAS domain S-box-containing protein